MEEKTNIDLAQFSDTAIAIRDSSDAIRDSHERLANYHKEEKELYERILSWTKDEMIAFLKINKDLNDFIDFGKYNDEERKEMGEEMGTMKGLLEFQNKCIQWLNWTLENIESEKEMRKRDESLLEKVEKAIGGLGLILEKEALEEKISQTFDELEALLGEEPLETNEEK